jgi:hypothetical protein
VHHRIHSLSSADESKATKQTENHSSAACTGGDAHAAMAGAFALAVHAILIHERAPCGGLRAVCNLRARPATKRLSPIVCSAARCILVARGEEGNAIDPREASSRSHGRRAARLPGELTVRE